ncbi:acetyltransferase [Legionella antarctica]|uniref:Acetyltransferase n=1 Tax=Legionella antarctica TaxID=2708020 RepID=A0A6F8T376_9GAMM|nr:GNAT family N-acetyltransferase [Legionella antarctica]BCA94416.1 acetyltransferase [Legionella antarctica]
MFEHYHIEKMNQEEVTLAVAWAAKEGWNPGLHDAACFYQVDPRGFFVGKLKGQMIAVGSAVIYDEHFAFCGFYIVAKPYRDQGYGLELTRARLDYIGKRNAGIDGVLPMLDKYARLGYQFAHNNIRYSLEKKIDPIPYNPSLVLLGQIDFSLLCDYDRLHFPALRPKFLKCWIQQKQSMALGFVQEKQLKGYGVIRACQQGYKMGPLFADTPEIANTLFFQLTQYAQGKVIFLDIPENNSFALDLVKHYQMTKVFATARMYLKGEPQLIKEHIFGITSFELG